MKSSCGHILPVMSAQLFPSLVLKNGKKLGNTAHDVNTLLVFLSITHVEASPSFLIKPQWETLWKAWSWAFLLTSDYDDDSGSQLASHDYNLFPSTTQLGALTLHQELSGSQSKFITFKSTARHKELLYSLFRLDRTVLW